MHKIKAAKIGAIPLILALGAMQSSLGACDGIGNITGSGNLTIGTNTSSYNQCITGDSNSFTGIITVKNGSLELNTAGDLANGTVNLYYNANTVGVFSLNGTAASIKSLNCSAINNTITLYDDDVLTITNADDTCAGKFVNLKSLDKTNSTEGKIIIAAGDQILSGNNSAYGGAMVINSTGTLLLSGAGTINNTNLTVNGTFDIESTTAGASIQGLVGDTTGNVNFTAKTLTISNANNATYSGKLNGDTNSIAILTGGNQTLNGNNSVYGGNINISTGNLSLTGDAALDNANVTVSGLLIVNANKAVTVKKLSGTGTVNVTSDLVISG